MADWFNGMVEYLLQLLGLSGTAILVLTVPLAIVQGFLGVFPFSPLIFIHISALGVVNGLLVSWAAGVLAAVVVYLVCKFLFAEPVRRRWGHRLERYEKWQTSFDHYGIWAIIVLRTLPVMPNNLISFMSAISPVRTSSYIWSSLIGILSHIWLFGIISSSILFPDMDIRKLIGTYIMFCVVLVAVFTATRMFAVRRRKEQEKQTRTVL